MAEQPSASKRAVFTEQPGIDERAVKAEKPSVKERAVKQEQPSAKKRTAGGVSGQQRNTATSTRWNNGKTPPAPNQPHNRNNRASQ